MQRDDPITPMIAKKIIEIAERGERAPKQIFALAMKGMGFETLLLALMEKPATKSIVPQCQRCAS